MTSCDTNEYIQVEFNDLLTLINSCNLSELRDDVFDIGYLQEHVLQTETNVSAALSLLSKIDKSAGLPKNLAIQIILLCGEHSKSDKWTSSKTLVYSQLLLKDMLTRFNCYSLLDLLLLFTINSFLLELRPKLMKDSWKKYPSATSCFSWILMNVKYPYLEECLNSLLPTCLVLVDDHLQSNKILGLQCLQHIANNVSHTDLSHNGRGSIIYSAVEHMIYSREPEIIPHLAKCLVALLTKTERRATKAPFMWSHFDDVLSIWLPSMEMEQKLVLQESYIDNLSGFLQAMGLSSVRWSNQLLRIFSEYCEQEHLCNKTLVSLLTFTSGTWPRISTNFSAIITILMKVCIKISKSDTVSKDSSELTKKLIKQCLIYLEKCSNTCFNIFLQEVEKNFDINDCYNIINLYGKAENKQTN